MNSNINIPTESKIDFFNKLIQSKGVTWEIAASSVTDRTSALALTCRAGLMVVITDPLVELVFQILESIF